MASGDTSQLIEVLKQKAGDEKRLPCADAFRVAHDLEVPVAQVGQACNDIGIKIMGCQLGCF
jgi:molybdate transport system regulatory protein